MGGDTAEPPESGVVPKSVPSAENCTLPVGMPAPGAVAVTVAVNVTGWPNTVGVIAETTVVVVSAALTVWKKVPDVPELKSPSPAYVTVTPWVPACAVLVGVVEAEPPERARVCSRLPSRNTDALPVGVPAPGSAGPTVTVKETGWPKTEGLAEEPIEIVVSVLLTTWPPGTTPWLVL